MAISIEKNLYMELRESYSGICISCQKVKWGDTEPDAEDYPCEHCGKNKVQGIENLLICGLIDIHE